MAKLLRVFYGWAKINKIRKKRLFLLSLKMTVVLKKMKRR